MNNKEKLKKHESYRQAVKNRLESSVPPKHATRATAYINYLKNEMRQVEAKIEALKLDGAK